MRMLPATLLVIVFAGTASAMEMGGPRNADGGGACGGIAGLACDAGNYCDYPLEAQCGAADQQGMCRPIPEVCTQQYDPVCGCDGETYGNTCEAAAAGISIASEGRCEG